MFTNKAKVMTSFLTTTNIYSSLKNMTVMCITLFALAACSTTQPNVSTMHSNGVEINDPYEDMNRKVFEFNKGVDAAFINPIVRGYQYTVPDTARDKVDNVLRNLNSPTVFINQLLQGDIEGAGTVLVRATINTILGIGGIFDLAAYEGIEYEQEDFGQTLGVWGIDHGPYLVVPIIGPSSARDYAGFFIDSYMDPLRWYMFNTDREAGYFGLTGAKYISLRSSLIDVLESLENSSIDYYAATRSAYYQRRAALLIDQDPETTGYEEIPDYDDFEDYDHYK